MNNNDLAWQTVMLARHPDRPYTLDYIELIMTGFTELHGDRVYGDDHAIVGGWARINDQVVMVIGHQKGRDVESRAFRNFGYARAEGYRKALRLMKLAAKFQRPVLTLIDTPGASPDIEAEERGVAEAIGRNLFEMSKLQTPILVCIIGEGGSGGALGIGLGDRMLMMENSYFSVISPEGCASILWENVDAKVEAAAALKITAPDLLKLGVIDKIIPEPIGGAHLDHPAAARLLKETLVTELKKLTSLNLKKLLKQRQLKYARMGVWRESFWK